MRRLISLFVILCLLAGLAWGAFGFGFNFDWGKLASALKSDKTATSEEKAAGAQDGLERTLEARLSDPGTNNGHSQTDPGAGKRSPFDVARISPNGVSVFAGKSMPNARVAVRADGKLVGTAVADENGEWVIASEHKFGSEDPKLEVVTSLPAKDGTASSDETGNLGRAGGSVEASRQKVDVGKAPPGGRAKAVTDKLMTALQGLVDEARAKIDRNEIGVEAGRDTADPDGRSSPGNEALAKTDGQGSTAVGNEPEKAGDTDSPVAGAPPSREKSATETAVVATNREAARPNSSDSAKSSSVPLPLKFEYRRAEMTDDGKSAASLLLEYVLLKQFQSITLTGHADERGSQPLNMDLSLSRLHRVAAYLRKGGYNGELELVAKGEAEPFAQVERSNFLKEELWELDRRVELRQAH